jgi:hypothetical protein
MTIVRSVLLAVLGGLCASSGAAQAVGRVEAAIADLAADGRPDNHELFLFYNGCPQDDADGLAVFEAVREMALEPRGLAELAGMLTSGVYAICGYAPLDEWYAHAFERLHAEGAAGAASAFVIRLGYSGRPIYLDMQEALLRAAEDPDFMGGRPREELVRTALYYRPRELWIDEAISAFRRAIPPQSIRYETFRLSREFGGVFYERLVREAPTLTDEAFLAVIRALGTEIRDGRADPNAAGMEELRAMTEVRAENPTDELPRGRLQSVR